MQPSGAEWYRRSILDFHMQMLGRGQDAIIARCIRQSVANDLANLDTASLVDEEHFARYREYSLFSMRIWL
jgi:hypothetical protein